MRLCAAWRAPARAAGHQLTSALRPVARPGALRPLAARLSAGGEAGPSLMELLRRRAEKQTHAPQPTAPEPIGAAPSMHGDIELKSTHFGDETNMEIMIRADGETVCSRANRRPALRAFLTHVAGCAPGLDRGGEHRTARDPRISLWALARSPICRNSLVSRGGRRATRPLGLPPPDEATHMRASRSCETCPHSTPRALHCALQRSSFSMTETLSWRWRTELGAPLRVLLFACITVSKRLRAHERGSLLRRVSTCLTVGPADIISALCYLGDDSGALHILDDMIARGMSPRSETLGLMLRFFFTREEEENLRALLSRVAKLGERAFLRFCVWEAMRFPSHARRCRAQGLAARWPSSTR